MNDLISRQAAIDAVSECATIWMSYTDDMSASEIAEEALSAARDTMIRIMREQPAAQPEIIRCKDCKHKHVENMVWVCPFGLPGGENFFCGYGTEPYKGK